MASTQRGYSLVEMSIVTIVMVVMSVVIAQSMRGLSSSQQATRDLAKIGSLAERAVARIEADVGYATRIFNEGTEAREFLARLELGAADEGGVLTASRLPVATIAGTFGPDAAGTVQTGNLLLLTRRDGTVRVDSSTDGTPLLRRVDLFRFVAWHLHDGGPTGVDLGRWGSVRMARRQDVDGVTDPSRRARLVAELCAAGIAVAWDPGAPAASAFCSLASDGAVTPFGADTLLEGDVEWGEHGILARRNVGVAANGTATPGVPRFAIATTGFPHGFELKRDGDGSGDLLLVRLVVSTPIGAQRQVQAFEALRQMAFREE